MNILGINTFHGDAAVGPVKEADMAGARDEQRLNRRKHRAGFPSLTATVVLEPGEALACSLKTRMDELAPGSWS